MSKRRTVNLRTSVARGVGEARVYNLDDDSPEVDRTPAAIFKCDECGRVVVWKISIGFPGCDHRAPVTTEVKP